MDIFHLLAHGVLRTPLSILSFYFFFSFPLILEMKLQHVESMSARLDLSFHFAQRNPPDVK